MAFVYEQTVNTDVEPMHPSRKYFPGAHGQALALAASFLLVKCVQGQTDRPAPVDAFAQVSVAQAMDVPDQFKGYDLVIMDDEWRLTNTLRRTRFENRHLVQENSAMWEGTIMRRQRYRVLTAHGADLLREQRFTVGAPTRLVTLDARSTGPDGRWSGSSRAGFRIRTSRPDEDGLRDAIVSFERFAPLAGQDIEVMWEEKVEGVFNTNEHLVPSAFPIVRAMLTVRCDTDITPTIMTFNGFPEKQIDPVEGSIASQNWVFHDVPPLPDDPLALVKNCVPFLSVSYLPGQGISMAEFDRRYPRDLLTGRKHMHVFTDYVESVRRRYPLHDVLQTVRDVVRFVHDSLTIVPDSTLQAEVPIGEYFYQRRIGRTKLFTLYRSLFRILDVPIHYCHVRSRFDGQYTSAMRQRDKPSLDLIAFKVPGTDNFHLICPNTLHERYLLDELPASALGGAMETIEYRDSGMGALAASFQLPVPATSDTYVKERVLLSVTVGSATATCTVKGTQGGHIPIALDVDTTAQRSRMDRMNAWLVRQFALPDVPGTITVRSDTLLPRTVRYAYERRVDLGRDVTDANVWDLTVRSLVHWERLLPDTTPIACARLLPFTYSRRSDVVVQCDGPIDATVLDALKTDSHNLMGQFTASWDRLDAHTIVLHFDLALFNDLVDRSTLPMVMDLQHAMDRCFDAPLRYTNGASEMR